MTRTMITAFASVLACAFGLGAGPSSAQDKYPSGPITLINPLSAGGGVDTAMRGLAHELQDILGQPVLVQSRPGAGGTIAGDFLARSKPDGYTIGLLQSTQAIPEVYSAILKAPYSSKDLRPVVRYMSLVFALPARADAPWKTLPQLIEHIKANPNTITWGRTTGQGHPLHLLAYGLWREHDLKVTEVPMKGASDAIANMLGGHLDVAFGVSTTSLKPHVESGVLKILAIHHPQRLTAFPDAPTFAEQKLDPGVMPVYNTFFAPAGTPDHVVKTFQDAVKAALQRPSMIEYANKNGFELYFGTEEDVKAELARDREVSSKLVAQFLEDKAKAK